MILAKTIKGYGMGVSGEGQMITHQAKKMTEEALLAFRDRFELPLTDEQVRDGRVLQAAGRLAGDAVPARAPRRARRLAARAPAHSAEPLPVPALRAFSAAARGHRRARDLDHDGVRADPRGAAARQAARASASCRSCPTSRARSGWRGCSARSASTRRSASSISPQDSEQLMFYKEDQHGQILEEGITEAGSISSFIAAGTSYSAHGVPMVPFYIYYSMFGYQRVGDLVWAAGDSRARGFLLGGTAGRTTLNGEGLQHEDGHSHLLFSVVPNCRAYDPALRATRSR